MRTLPDIRTLPQWAQIYIAKLKLQIEELTTRNNKHHDLYVAAEEEVTLLKEKLARHEAFVSSFRALVDDNGLDYQDL